MSSTVYASYLASHSDNPNHLHHIYEFQELATMIAKEQIELYMPRIETMVNNAVNRSISSALSGSMQAMDIDIKRIVDITCKELNAQFHSEEISHWVAETLKIKLEDALKNIDLKLIV
jgi:hypothetical protein